MNPIHLSVLSIAMLSAAGAAASGPLAVSNGETEIRPQEQMLRIAEPVSLNLELIEHGRQQQQPLEIHRPGAAFIKVHFSQFNPPQGYRVEVSNPERSQLHVYGTEHASAMTYDPEVGEDGRHQFSSLSIIGDTAVISLVAEGKSIQETIQAGKHQVSIDYIMEGLPEDLIELSLDELTDPVSLLDQGSDASRSTCGVNERRDVQCWAGSHPVEFERSRPVARLLINGGSLCTAWRVGPDNRMFTNNHCVSSQSSLVNTEVWFNYQRSGCGTGSTGNTTIVSGNDLLATDFTLDYTLFTVSNFNSIQSFGHFGLDVREATLGEIIYIPQHGSGNPKELAIESDQNAGGLCRIDDVTATGRGSNTDMGYFCDTIGGSSGSPVLARSSNDVLALHHFGGCTNQGVKISRIWPQVSSFFGGVIPDGDDSGNPPPPPPPPPGNCSVEVDFESGASGWANDGASTCATGAYTLGTPAQISNGGVTTQVGGDHTSGSGNAVYTAANSSAGVDDVDGGNCILTSPTWTVSEASTLSAWYFHGQRDSGDDPSGDFFRLEVSTNGGSSYTTIASNGDSASNASWTQASAAIPAGASVKLRMQASDGAGPGDLIEAGLDDISICAN